jgi:hypothetical protein
MEAVMRSLYEGNMNVSLNRFRSAFSVRNGSSFFIIQVMDSENNVAREHYFKNTDDMLNAAKFLKRCGLINV